MAKKSKISSLFPTWATVDEREAGHVTLPAAASAYFAPSAIQRELGDGTPTSACFGEQGSACKIFDMLPVERRAKYGVLRTMAKDPTINSAIKMHLANALAPSTDTGKSVQILPVEAGAKSEIVDSLNAALMPFIEEGLNEWAQKAAVYGVCFVRVYGKPGVGVENVRSDFYTRPEYVQKYEQGGKLAGFTASYQGTTQYGKQVKLLPPWYFVPFEIPEWADDELVEPISVGGKVVDLSLEDSSCEGLVESQQYGASLIATAYAPWRDMLDAICSLKMSRRNAARLERLVGIQTGRLDPERAARYLDMVAERISNASGELEKQSWLQGNVQTVVNHIVPVFGDKGGMQIEEVKGTPDINGLEDVMFHVKRLGSALGVDPALLGFGDLLAGGLGDGGFFRVSVIAATKAQMLRQAMQRGIDRLCELHVAYKYGKVFLPGDKPWKISFAASTSAIEREAQSALESKASIAGAIGGALGIFDQNFEIVDKRELARVIWETIGLPEDKFDLVYTEKKAAQAEEAAQEPEEMPEEEPEEEALETDAGEEEPEEEEENEGDE